MVQRSVALCEGKLIGIESIYTVVAGKQINIPDKIRELRKKSQANKLFCPCECGANLILVASDRSLVNQHFRIKHGTEKKNCEIISEGKTSIESKIVLKCWLDDKLKATDLESRVPINSLEDIKRKPEFTFLSKEKKLGIRYWRTRANIKDELVDILETNNSGINIIYIVDSFNGGETGQFPEAMMKIQEKQEYCLLLSINGIDYDKASLDVVYYDQNIDGFWVEIPIVSLGKLNQYDLLDGNLHYAGCSVKELKEKVKQKFQDDLLKEVNRREQAKKKAEQDKKKAEEYQQQLIIKQEAAAKAKKEEAERLKEERRIATLNEIQEIRKSISNQNKIVIDSNGNRWVQCKICGKISTEKDFSSLGGPGNLNKGKCKECMRNIKEEDLISLYSTPNKIKYNPNECPECGHTLIKRNGKNGPFIGCSNFPRCRFTKNI